MSDKLIENVIEAAEVEGLCLSNLLARAIETDDDDDTGRVLRTYLSANAEGRELIDNVLISLCGWSLPTLCKENGFDLEGVIVKCDDDHCEASFSAG